MVPNSIESQERTESDLLCHLIHGLYPVGMESLTTLPNSISEKTNYRESENPDCPESPETCENVLPGCRNGWMMPAHPSAMSPDSAISEILSICTGFVDSPDFPGFFDFPISENPGIRNT